MKTTMKKTAAYLLAILLVFQMIPAFAETTSRPFTLQDVEYREKLNISAVVDTLVVGHTLELTVDEADKYQNIKWTTNKEGIVKVENGFVTGLSAGTVTITATEDGHNDSVTLRVIEAKAESNTGKETVEGGTGESGTGESGTGESTSEKMIVIINGAKQKTTYSGEVIWLDYVASSSTAGFEKEKVHLKEESREHLAHGLTCGVWQDQLAAEDFYYEGNDNVEFVVSSGWLQIKPAVLNIIVNDAEKNEGEDDPVFTAEYDTLLGNDTAETLGLTFQVSENGQITPAIADDGIIAERYRKGTVMAGTLTIKQMNEYPLYNLASIKVGSTETWYRLGKTSIKTEKTLEEYLKGITKDGNVKIVDKDEYQASLYNFDDIEIVVNGKKYVYNCAKNAEAILLGADYYTTSVKNVEAVLNKIGGLDKNNNPRWLIPENQQYKDPNKTSSFHMNYTITLHEADVQAEVQDIYYMLSVDGSQDYYKLPKGSITAKPYDKVTIIDQKLKQVKESDYILTPYNFTNTVITIDGVDYKYNDGSLDEYENYFTVEFDMVVKSERFNSNANWFKNTESWLDGAYEQYGTLPNYTKAFHANYNATTHKALPRTRSVTIESNWPADRIAYTGAKITLTAKLEGFGENVTLQWQYSTDLEKWTDEPGANGITYTYTLNDTTANYYWRVFADEVK